MRRFPLIALLALIPLGSLGALTWASPASQVTPTPIARATFPAFKVKSDPSGPVAFRARAKRPVDMFVRQHDYAPGGHTGWHSHPGPVFLQVTKGTLTVYDYADRRCRRSSSPWVRATSTPAAATWCATSPRSPPRTSA